MSFALEDRFSESVFCPFKRRCRNLLRKVGLGSVIIGRKNARIVQ